MVHAKPIPILNIFLGGHTLFLQKIATMEAELQNAKREALAYKSMLEVAQRQGIVNGDITDAASFAQVPACEGQASGGASAEELESAKAEVERAHRAEKQLKSQLEVMTLAEIFLLGWRAVSRSSSLKSQREAMAAASPCAKPLIVSVWAKPEPCNPLRRLPSMPSL